MKKIPKGLLEEVVTRLVREFAPEEIFLFGSHVWGTANEDSDVDLFVIIRESHETPLRRAQRAHCSLIGLNFPKDILVRTRAETEESRRIPSSVTTAVLENGHRIYG